MYTTAFTCKKRYIWKNLFNFVGFYPILLDFFLRWEYIPISVSSINLNKWRCIELHYGGAMNGNEVFAERVKIEREKKKLSATDLAKSLGIQKTRVSMWETQGTVPRPEMLFKLCDFFGVSADYLLGNDKADRKNPRNETIYSIQRGLDKLSEADLETAQNMLRAVFKDAFGGQ